MFYPKHYSEEERAELLAWGSQGAYGNVDDWFGERPTIPNEYFAYTFPQYTSFDEVQRRWDKWFEKRCIRLDDAREAYVHLAKEIMDRNGIDHTDPEKEKIQKEWDECILEELSHGHTDNDILSMKIVQIQYAEDISRSQNFLSSRDFDTQLEDIHMKWYVVGALLLNLLLLLILALLCRYCLLDKWIKARRERKRLLKEEMEAELREMNQEEMQVFEKDFLKNWRRKARDMYLKQLFEKKLLEAVRKEKEKKMVQIQNLRNIFRLARARNYPRRTNLTVHHSAFEKPEAIDLDATQDDPQNEDQY